MSNTEQRQTDVTLYWTQVQFEVSSFVAALIPDYHDARDVVQQVALVVINKFEDYDQTRSFRDWALGIARFEVLKYRERHARDKLVFCQAIIDQIAEAYRGPDKGGDEVCYALRQCLKTVKGRNREAMQMWYVEEVDGDKIAEKMGLSRNAVYIMLHRLRTVLRNCVERRLTSLEGGL